MLIWGLNFAVSKAGLAEMPPLMMMALRFGVAALILCPFYPLSPRLLVHVLPLSLTLGSVHFGLMFTGLARVDAALAALLVPIQVPIAAVLGAFVFRERLTVRLLIGLVVAFAGITLIVGEPRASDPVPVLMILGASFVWAIANIQMKSTAGINPYALTGWIAFFAAPQLLLLSFLIEFDQWHLVGSAGWRGWGAVFFQAIGVSIMSYGFWYPLIRVYPVNIMMPLTLLVPVIAVAFAVLLLGEELTWWLVSGGLLTLAGVAITVVRR